MRPVVQAKFHPGDVVTLKRPKRSGWTARDGLCKGTLGTAMISAYENGDLSNPVIVMCDFPGVSSAWWVYESELELVAEPISVDTSSLL